MPASSAANSNNQAMKPIHIIIRLALACLLNLLAVGLAIAHHYMHGSELASLMVVTFVIAWAVLPSPDDSRDLLERLRAHNKA